MATHPQALITGGCLCGAIRYEVRGEALQTSLCHCEDCRKASAAPFIAWTFFKAGSLTWVLGAPKKFIFAHRERSFCGDCGTPLEFHEPGDDRFCEIATCTLDDPASFPPTDQCWLADEILWTRHIAALPRFEHTSPLPGE